MKKSRLATAVCVMALAFLLVCGFTGEAEASSRITVMTATQAVYMRSGPGPEHSVQTTIPAGAKVDVYDVSSGWYEVDYNGYHGFTYCTFLKEVPGASSAASSSDSKASQSSGGVSYGSAKTMYASTGVRIRKGPSAEYAVIGSLNEGQSVQVIGAREGWYEVSVSGGTGYVCGQYLTESKPSGSSSAGSNASKPAAVSGEQYKTSSALRMRATPSNDGKIVGTIPAGATVGVLSKGHGDDGWWYEVNYDGMTGYSYAYYLYK